MWNQSSLKYEWFKLSGCKDMEVRKFEFLRTLKNFSSQSLGPRLRAIQLEISSLCSLCGGCKTGFMM